MQFPQMINNKKGSITPLIDIYAEIVDSVIIGNVLHHFSQPLDVLRQLAVFNVGADDIAEDPPEVFMPRVGKKTPGVGEHSHKPA